ncbi:hypothetical protein [Halopiger xanaduensis]|uniref:Ig-like domain-containing protein n=1 Tax=Halopiger xanaduensis (strain DSM 18323 / JCM 14033 / SH-6) TaxID=797210 RepID=F8D9T1_HALXS|nr:hypothetical protein [Halopiger xanaduensis]AEH35708.1 hypothetical protein Halxa_1074 [Halopiger xanaduensis SH-6]
MDRRTLVRIAPGVGLGFLAGCLGAADDSSDGDGETAGNETAETESETGTETANETETDGGDDVLEDDAELTFETLEVGPFEAITTTALDDSADKGDGEKAADEEPVDEGATVYHRITIENASNRDRELSIRIDRDGTTVLEGTNELSPETALEIVIGEPGTYETTLEAGGIRNTSSISRSGTPCEESRTVVSFTDGGIETNTTTSC